MRALNELRSLKLRPNQSISEFCVVLEKLARKANPNCAITERSLEYAQILLDNLREWPEHVQLLSLLHRSDPGSAYNEIKQLAITIEQARTVYGTGRKSMVTGTEWKKRAQAYNSHRESDRYRPPNTVEHQIGYTDKKKDDVETRKCFNCSKFGHIARNCPLGRPVVNNIVENRAKTKDNRKGARISDLVRQTRAMGMVVEKGSATTNLVGKKSTAWVNMLNERVRALIDTGSMISIVPIGLLARAQDNGFDVDSLTVIDRKTLEPVYDASNNEMQFLGGVSIAVKIEGGSEYEVAFYISKEKGHEVLLGTNALEGLGVQIHLPRAPLFPIQRSSHSGKVTVARRTYIPPYSSAVVQARCDIDEGSAERIIWPISNGMAAGVFKIENCECAIPVISKKSEPMMWREGDEIGHWSTEKWREGWDELKPALLEERGSILEPMARKQKLLEQIAQNRSSKEIPEDIRILLEEKREAFAVCDQELSATSEVEMDVDTGDHPPIKLKARPVPLAMRAKLKEMLNDLVSRKIIEKSASAWAFPIVLVEKKDGSLRLCVDYRELNKCIRQDAYPMPTIDAMLQSMAGKRYFSTLDLYSGYWQIPLTQEAREKTAFATTEGLFQFRVTPFGLSTSPAVFQRMMDTVLKDMLGNEVFCYIDDIMICTKTRERHLELLRAVFTRLIEAGLRLKAEKCVLMETKVSFLGHVIDGAGIHTDPRKVEAVKNYPVPEDVRQLRTFLGMAAFYRKFCLNFAKTASPLFELTSSKRAWNWTSECDEAFEKVKQFICSAPVLKQPDMEKARTGEKPFVIYTDASTTGLGAVLAQEDEDKYLHPYILCIEGLK
uniref:RNA-directed DNA polymerase n=1 Tax=Haemonchus contortus TaxID=6289 RepID=A0A7I5E602_HAECO